MFDHLPVGNDLIVQAYERPGSDPARLVIARLSGTARRHAHWREPTEAETAAAVSELQEIIAGRDDGPARLAEVAGLSLGFHEGGLDEPRAQAIARFCLAAGADQDLVPNWVEEGRRRAENARRMPYSGRPRIPRRSPSSGQA